MSIKLPDRKRLWGRSGSRCAICNADLLPEASMGEAVILGEEAHIVAREPDGPRGDGPLTADQRDSYSNLILLCPRDHAFVDAMPTGPRDFPVEKLLEIKRLHESKIRERSGFDARAQLNEEMWATLIEGYASRIGWDDWSTFSGYMFAPGLGPFIRNVDHARLTILLEWVYSRAWPPGHEKIRELIEGSGHLLSDLLSFFDRNSEEYAGREGWRIVRDYKKIEWNPEEYERLLGEYRYAESLLHDFVLELTRFGNEICNIVRIEIDPMFRFDEGVLVVKNGPTINFEYELLRPEFRAADYAGLPHPYRGFQEFDEVDRFNRDVSSGYKRPD